LERLVEAGAPIEQLELVALGVKYGQGLCAYAREQADHPMAVAFADVERVLRYAAAGQKARDALAAQAWREERHRKVQAARQRAIADGADAPAAPRDVGALARFALEGGGLPPSSSPGGAAPAPRAARAAAQLFAEAPLPPPPKSSAAPPIDPKRAFFYGQLAMAECELASRAEKDAKKDALRAEYRAEFNEDMEDER
jgi:hypothetical protein